MAAELHAVFEAVSDEGIDAATHQVNHLLEVTQARPYLNPHDDEPWRLHFHGTGEAVSAGWVADCATGLAVDLGASSTTG